MRALTLAPLSQLAGLTPLAVRMILGIIMLAHGAQKLEILRPGPRGDGRALAGAHGIRGDVRGAYRRDFTRRRALVAAHRSPAHGQPDRRNPPRERRHRVSHAPGAVSSGVELSLALIAGFLAILLAGPGKLSLDHALGIERDAEGSPARRWKHGHCVGSPPRKPE